MFQLFFLISPSCIYDLDLLRLLSEVEPLELLLGLVRKRTSSRVIRALANFFSVVLFYLVGDLPIVLLVLVGDLPIVLLVPLPAFIPTMQKTDGNGNFECFKCKTVNRLEMEG